MNLINRNLVIYTGLFAFLSIAIASEKASKPLFDFSEESAARQWISINDGVMGGISEGDFRITDNNTLKFSGTLSLENNGGFASIRTQPAELKLDGYDTIGLRLKGDGRTYYFNARTSSRNRASSYRAAIKTQTDTWQDVHIPLNTFVFNSFGRVVTGADPLKAKDIQSVGFTLSDKKPGPFKLEVSEIRAAITSGNNQITSSDHSDGSAGGNDIIDTATEAGSFNTLVAAVTAAGLVEPLKTKGPFTVFAPSDEAFAKLPEGTIEELLKPENKDKLTKVLTYHVVPEIILLNTRTDKTLQGQSIQISTTGKFQVNGVKVTASDIMASNGVIHVIDAVLLPPEKDLTPKQAAREVIQLAIQRGVPLFNAGQPSACAGIYEVAADSLLKTHTNALDDKNRLILQDALDKVRGDDDPTRQAWTLRRALDAVYKSLAE